jgi:hypothetical protein
MIAFLTRVAGLILFAVAILALITDGIRSIAADAFIYTPLQDSWTRLSDSSLAATRSFVEGQLGAEVWSSLAATVLGWPSFAVIGLPGLALMLVGARRRPGGRRR